MIENVIEIEDGAVFGRFPAGTLVRIVGRPAAPGRGCRSQRCQEFILPDTASYGIDVDENGEYQVVREGLMFYPSTIGPVDQPLDLPVRSDLARAALVDACRAQGMDRQRGVDMARTFPDHPASKRTQCIADALVRWYRAGASGELVPK